MSTNVGAGDVVWRGGATVSELTKIPGQTICGFYIPSGFAGTTLKINATHKDTLVPVVVKDSAGDDVSYTVAAGSFLRVNPSDFAGIDMFELVSNATEAANTVVKAATRVIE